VSNRRTKTARSLAERSIAEMNGNMEGKVALVTGASGGIGLETAREFAKAGASVTHCARRTNVIDEEVERLTTDTASWS
jgi:3-oxoacyl-[acyl-carrier protein] reductase